MTDREDVTANASLLYQEYVRLSEVCDRYVAGSFSDLKIGGSLGALIAWAPVLQLVKAVEPSLIGADVFPAVMLFGFIAIMLVAVVLFAQDLLKQSLIAFYAEQVRKHESELSRALKLSDTNTLRVASSWTEWRAKRYEPLVKPVLGLLALTLALFPPAVVWYISARPRAWRTETGRGRPACSYGAIRIAYGRA